MAVDVAGRRIDLGSFPAQPHQTTTYTWDGRNAYGRALHGAQSARVTLNYVYDAIYNNPAPGRGFAVPTGVAITDNPAQGFAAPTSGAEASKPARQKIIFSRTYTTTVGAMDFRASVAGWSLDVQRHTNLRQAI
ncbi:MAG: hypothetical protein ABTR27_11760 [Candidatus Competibacter phosphatis]